MIGLFSKPRLGGGPVNMLLDEDNGFIIEQIADT